MTQNKLKRTDNVDSDCPQLISKTKDILKFGWCCVCTPVDGMNVMKWESSYNICYLIRLDHFIVGWSLKWTKIRSMSHKKISQSIRTIFHPKKYDFIIIIIFDTNQKAKIKFHCLNPNPNHFGFRTDFSFISRNEMKNHNRLARIGGSRKFSRLHNKWQTTLDSLQSWVLFGALCVMTFYLRFA